MHVAILYVSTACRFLPINPWYQHSRVQNHGNICQTFPFYTKPLPLLQGMFSHTITFNIDRIISSCILRSIWIWESSMQSWYITNLTILYIVRFSLSTFMGPLDAHVTSNSLSSSVGSCYLIRQMEPLSTGTASNIVCTLKQSQENRSIYLACFWCNK